MSFPKHFQVQNRFLVRSGEILDISRPVVVWSREILQAMCNALVLAESVETGVSRPNGKAGCILRNSLLELVVRHASTNEAYVLENSGCLGVSLGFSITTDKVF